MYGHQFTDVQTQLLLTTINNNVDDGSCTPFLYGCTDPAAAATISGWRLTLMVRIYPGCTGLTATNYDPNTNLDDGSCHAAALVVTLQVSL